MITPGWKRRNNSCPQCHMSGRVGERFGFGVGPVQNSDGEGTAERTTLKFSYGTIVDGDKLTVSVDICDNCGVLYAYEAT